MTTMLNGENQKGRIHLMDEIRGFDLLLMLVYHGLYTVGYLFGLPMAKTLFKFFSPAEPFFAGLFIFICGVSCRLSHNNWKRGGLLLGAALVISGGLWLVMREEMIWFGILHFLAVSILLFALFRPLLDRVAPVPGIIACALLMLITWWIPAYRGSLLGIKGLLAWPLPETVVSQWWLYPLGLGDGTSADYFPLLPWIFCFLAGTFTGVWAAQGRFPSFMYPSRLPWLSWLGRHTLLIYVLHQPVIYLLCEGGIWLWRALTA